MRILVVTPESPGTTLGNSITAMRWAAILDQLGHEVQVGTAWTNQQADLMIALHARRSHSSILRFRGEFPSTPIVVALTGTDLYRDLRSSPEAQQSLDLATRIVALQEAARSELSLEHAAKLRVIYQSAKPPSNMVEPLEGCFEVCVLSHLREVKDPLRAAFAARLLSAESRIRVTHAGRVLEPEMETLAREETARNPQYRWIGEQSHEAALHLLARSQLLVLSSEMEGGASAIAEAVVCRVPVLCSDISGNRGMLGNDYPGYFRLRNTEQLAALLGRAEKDREFLGSLRKYVEQLRSRFAPEKESAAWRALLGEMFKGNSTCERL